MTSFGPVVDIAFNISDFMFQGRYNGKSFADHQPDLLSVLARARARGVVGALALGGSVDDSEMGIQWLSAVQAMRLTPPFSASTFRNPPTTLLPAIGCTVGVHPTNAKSLLLDDGAINAPLLARLAAATTAAATKGVLAAIGEIGLDDVRDQHSAPPLQRGVFAAQLDALIPAARIGFAAAGAPDRLPSLLLHLRGDDATTTAFLDILLPRRATYAGGIVHSFTGSIATAERLVAAGFYIGVDGITPREAEGLAALPTIPLARIVVETDAPWCAIRPSNEGFKAAGGAKAPAPLLAALKAYPEVSKERHAPLPIDAAVLAAAAAATVGEAAEDGSTADPRVLLRAALGVFDPEARPARATASASTTATSFDVGGFVPAAAEDTADGLFSDDDAINSALRTAVELSGNAIREGRTNVVKGRVEPAHVQAVVELLCALHPEAKELGGERVRAILIENTIMALGL